jgi:hypothetical protein
MAEVLRDLWPEIDTSVLAPVAALRFQASQLREKTVGLLEAAVRIWTDKDNDTVYEFQIVAPALERYTYVLFQAWHRTDFVYPVTVRFEPWVDAAEKKAEKLSILELTQPALMRSDAPSGLRKAASPEDFVNILGDLLGSEHTRSVLSSLIARINDAKAQAATSPQSHGAVGSADQPLPAARADEPPPARNA